jgi:hypothetical protein
MCDTFLTHPTHGLGGMHACRRGVVREWPGVLQHFRRQPGVCVCVCVCLCMCAGVAVCMHVCVYVRLYVYMLVCLCVLGIRA